MFGFLPSRAKEPILSFMAEHIQLSLLPPGGSSESHLLAPQLNDPPRIDSASELSLLEAGTHFPFSSPSTSATPSRRSFTSVLSVYATLIKANEVLWDVVSRIVDADDADDTQRDMGKAGNPPEPFTLNAQPFNALHGRTLGRNLLRVYLYKTLTNPWSRLLIFLLIILQTVLLVLGTAHSTAPYRQFRFGQFWDDYCYLTIFIVFTLECTSKIIVYGFFQYPTLAQEFISANGGQLLSPHTAPRPFLRNGYNWLDLISVIAFWITFAMKVGEVFSGYVYVLRMLSCLRIMRQLRITNGTAAESIVLSQGLRKAAPTLTKVVLFLGFFWLFFAVVGVQMFKSNLKRACAWKDPGDSNNTFTLPFQLCGGWMADNGAPMPWLTQDGAWSSDPPQGYICPMYSVCVETLNPYNGTLSFDNIFQSLELVFVIMSANSFSDIMYDIMDSGGTAAALFFIVVISILYYWLITLLIGVIASAFRNVRQAKLNSTGDDATAHKPGNDGTAPRLSTIQNLYRKTKVFWLAVITTGLLAQTLISSTMKPSTLTLTSRTESVVTAVLLAEMIIRLSIDRRGFHRSKRNLADLVIAVITTVMEVPTIKHSGEPYAWLTLFQIIRVYRVVWAIPPVREVLMQSFANLPSLFNLIGFMFLLVFLAAILGTQIFRDALPVIDSSGNYAAGAEFTNLWDSFLDMYQVFTGENWTALLYQVTNYTTIYGTAWINAIFVILWYIISSLVILNMFTARIHENLEIPEGEKRLCQVQAFFENEKMDIRTGSYQYGSDCDSTVSYKHVTDTAIKDFLRQDNATDTICLRDDAQLVPNVVPPQPVMGSEHKLFQPARDRMRSTARKLNMFTSRCLDKDRSLFIFSPNNSFRKVCQALAGRQSVGGEEANSAIYSTLRRIFRTFIHATVLIKIVLACVTTPLYRKEYFELHVYSVVNWFVICDLAIAIILLVEAAVKSISGGLISGPNPYLRGGRLIDAVILVTLWIQVAAELYNQGQIARAVQAFQALRVLRLLTLNEQVLIDLIATMKRGGIQILSALAISTGMLIPFAIYGVRLFAGKMDSCNDTSNTPQSGYQFPISDLNDCVGETAAYMPYNWPILAPREIVSSYYSFDDFRSSFYTLFLIVSQEGWADVMWSAKSITTGRRTFLSNLNTVFFLTFNFCGTFFIMTLFLSILLQNYAKQTGKAYLTKDQRCWNEQQRLLHSVHPRKRPSSSAIRPPWRMWCYRISTADQRMWQIPVQVTLGMHFLLLCSEFSPSPSWWDTTRDVFLVAMLAVHINMRVLGLSWHHFRRRIWDVYSLASVAGALITSILAMVRPNYYTLKARQFFQDAVCLLLIPNVPVFDQLWKAAIASVPLISNLLAAWFVLILFFAVALTQIFGLTRFGPNENGNANFRTVPKALILLFRMSLGEGRSVIMEDYATIVAPYCTTGISFNSDCGSPELARIFFISWKVLSMFLFTNLFVSLIYESLSAIHRSSNDESPIVSKDDLRQFKDAWATLDPSGKGYIPERQLPVLLARLRGIFSMRIHDGDMTVKRLIEVCSEPSPVDGSARGLNINILNEKLKDMPVRDVRRRREALDRLQEEVLLSNRPGFVTFSSALSTLPHYKLMKDSKGLSFTNFVQRRKLLEGVKQTVQHRASARIVRAFVWRQSRRQSCTLAANGNG